MPDSLLAGVPHPQNPVILNFPAASNGENLAPAHATAGMFVSKAKNTVDTKTENDI